MQFLGPQHISLFIFGLMVTILFIVPYTLLVPLTPYLVKLSHWRIFSLINQVKPLVDSYEAPFKDRYRFWTEAMLIYRMIIIITSTIFSQQPEMILLVIIVIHSCIIFSGFAIYKSWTISAVETTLHVNIITNSLAIHFGKNDCIPTYVGVGVALACFLAVVLSNAITALFGLKLSHLKHLNPAYSEVIVIHQSSENSEYREPLMDN